MVTWLLIPLQHSNPSLKTGFRSIGPLCCLHPYKTRLYICFVVGQWVKRANSFSYFIWKETFLGFSVSDFCFSTRIPTAGVTVVKWGETGLPSHFHHHQEVSLLEGNSHWSRPSGHFSPAGMLLHLTWKHSRLLCLQKLIEDESNIFLTLTVLMRNIQQYYHPPVVKIQPTVFSIIHSCCVVCL